MKIFIEYDFTNESGKGKFIQRLCREWDRTGVKYSDSPEGCDIRLCITRDRTKWKGKTVLRIDGAHQPLACGKDYKSKRIMASLKWKNKLTASRIKKADAVIYQTEFCKKMGRKVFKAKNKNEHIIFNGAHPDEFNWNGEKEKLVIASAMWVGRPHKRLKEMIEIANNYCEIHDDVKFCFAGECEGEFKTHENVFLPGHMNIPDLDSTIAKSACMLNLAYYDWCPNAVVEGLIGGLPVICSNGTGIEEIVRDSGIILKLDSHDSKTLKRAAKPPKIEYDPVYKALDRILYDNEKFEFPEHLHIKTVAKQYEEVFRGIVK